MSETINVNQYEETNEQTGETTTNKDTAKDKFDRAKNSLIDKAADGIQYVCDHPGKIFAGAAAAWMTYKTAVRPIVRDIKEARHEQTYFDRYGSQHTYELKRKMTNNEKNECDMYVQNGGNAYEWLRKRRIARK